MLAALCAITAITAASTTALTAFARLPGLAHFACLRHFAARGVCQTLTLRAALTTAAFAWLACVLSVATLFAGGAAGLGAAI